MKKRRSSCMNESYEMLLKRRSIRAYRPDPIPDDVLDRILLAGKYAPSAMGLQNRHFSVVLNRTLMNEIVAAAEGNRAAFAPGHVPFYGAPAVVVLSAPKDFRHGREDCACAIENIALAAYALGLGSCYICSVLPGLRDASVEAKLDLPDNYEPYGCICVGYPLGAAPEPKRRRADDVSVLR